MNIPEAPYMIGLAAPSSAGKTSLAEALQERLGERLAVLNFDNYDLYPSGSQQLEQVLKGGSIRIWEDPALFDGVQYVEDLKALKRGRSIQLLGRSREAMERGEEAIRLSPAEIVLAEGIFAFTPEYQGAAEAFDRRYYLHIPTETMVERRLARTPHDSTDPWDQQEYVRGEMVEGTALFVLPQLDLAHFILDGTRPLDELVNFVISDLPYSQ